jgi:hypothetical protein
MGWLIFDTADELLDGFTVTIRKTASWRRRRIAAVRPKRHAPFIRLRRL